MCNQELHAEISDVVAWYVSYLPDVSRGSSIIPKDAPLRSATSISNVILDVQAGEFFFIGAILHHICARMLSLRFGGSRHGMVLLALLLDASSCPHIPGYGTHLLRLYPSAGDLSSALKPIRVM